MSNQLRQEMLDIARLIMKNHANGFRPRPDDAVRLAELVLAIEGEKK